MEKIMTDFYESDFYRIWNNYHKDNKMNSKEYYNMNYTTTINDEIYDYKGFTNTVPYETGTIQYIPEQYGETYYEGDFYPAQVPQELSNLKPINWDEIFKKSGTLKDLKTVEERIEELHEELDKLVSQQKDKIIEKRLRKEDKISRFKLLDIE